MMVLTRRACSSAWSLARSVERRLDLSRATRASALSQMMLPLFESRPTRTWRRAVGCPASTIATKNAGGSKPYCVLARRAQTAESKFRALARLLRRTREPAIVFTEYRDTLTRLAEALRRLLAGDAARRATPRRSVRQNLRLHQRRRTTPPRH